MKVIDGGIERDMTPEEEELFEKNQDILAKEERKDKIQQIKQELTDTDYKIIKSYEYFLAGKEVPYDIEELHKERQKLRDEIGILESEI
ncbi:MAG: hypothetical protein ACLRZ9_12945 [Eubacterium sp.]